MERRYAQNGILVLVRMATTVRLGGMRAILIPARTDVCVVCTIMTEEVVPNIAFDVALEECWALRGDVKNPNVVKKKVKWDYASRF